MLRQVVLVIALAALAALGGCPGSTATAPRTAAVSGERLTVPGAPVPIYAYAGPIVAYADGDRGAYVVRVAAGAAGDPVRAELAARGSDDVVGDDGYVMRLTAAEREAMAGRAGVVAVSPLQPSARRRDVAAATAATRAVRIDLFADATTDEGAAIAAWIAMRGGRVRWQGPTALIAELPVDAVGAAASLSPVRWVE